jgi:hypothetical protein
LATSSSLTHVRSRDAEGDAGSVVRRDDITSARDDQGTA